MAISTKQHFSSRWNSSCSSVIFSTPTVRFTCVGCPMSRCIEARIASKLQENFYGSRCVLLSDSDWKRLRDEFIPFPEVDRNCGTKTKSSVPLTRFNQKKEFLLSEEEEKIKIAEFAGRIKKEFDNEKLVPIELKRALFLSDVLTEKTNQLRFRDTLRDLLQRKKNKEIERKVEEENEYRRTLKNAEKETKSQKRRFGRILKHELHEFEERRKKLEKLEREQEQVELLSLGIQLRQDECKKRIQEMKGKLLTRLVLQNDQLEKRAHKKILADIDREENNFAKFQNSSIYANEKLVEHRLKDSLRRWKFFKNTPTSQNWPKKIVHSHSNKEELNSPAQIESPQILRIEKSEIEKKRERHAEILKRERISILGEQLKELDRRKSREKGEKQEEARRRCENLEVTKSLENRKVRSRREQMTIYRTVWTEQCSMKTLARQSERQEDARRLKKLQTDMQAEDEHLLRDAEIMLEEYTKKGKNTLPIIKYVKDFRKSRHPQPSSRNEIWNSQIPI